MTIQNKSTSILSKMREAGGGAMTIRFGSVCSGIEAASVAWEQLGWKAAWLSEIEPFQRAVLSHHYPDVPLYGDFTRLRNDAEAVADIDLLVGGTPCQAFSVAGLRQSLADDRGNLTLKFVRLADAIDDVRGERGQPGLTVVWENVPGVLSTKDNAFGCFLAALVGADTALVPPGGGKWTRSGLVVGPRRSAAWTIKDAEYFGLAQRRERVFVVANPRNGADPSEILFEPEGVRRHFAPSRNEGEAVAALTANGVGTCGADDNQGQAGHLIAAEVAGTLGANHGNTKAEHAWTGQLIGCEIAQADCRNASGRGLDVGHGESTSVVMAFGGGNTRGSIDVSTALTAHSGRYDFDTETIVAFGWQNSASQGDSVSEHVSPTLDKSKTPAVCHSVTTHVSSGVGWWDQKPVAATLRAQDSINKADTLAVNHIGVRRLLPTECEALQGFPRDYTLVPHRGKPAADGPRYKALGNSMAVPVMRWIGERIAMVEGWQ